LATPRDQLAADVQWLYRQGELVLGPVGTQQLIENLYRGEVSGRTEVSPLGTNQFLRLGELDVFRLHLAKAEAKLRVDAAARAREQKKQAHRRVKMAGIALVTVILSVGAVAGAYKLAVNPPWATRDPLADLDFGIEAPTIKGAHASSGEELVDYPLRGGDRGGVRRSRTLPPGSAAVAGRMPSGVTTGPDGLEVAQFDRTSINSVITAKQPTLKTCFVEEARRNPNFAAKIPIEFTIGNDGHVARLWVDHPQYKEGPLADCLLRELQKWPFHPYQGEQANVSLSFRIGKSG
jgi:hypothetical protein